MVFYFKRRDRSQKDILRKELHRMFLLSKVCPVRKPYGKPEITGNKTSNGDGD